MDEVRDPFVRTGEEFGGGVVYCSGEEDEEGEGQPPIHRRDVGFFAEGMFRLFLFLVLFFLLSSFMLYCSMCCVAMQCGKVRSIRLCVIQYFIKRLCV